MSTSAAAILGLEPGAIDPDTAPEAPFPAPTLDLYMQVVENDAPQNFDGGKLLLGVMRAGRDPAIIASNLVISAETDAFLMQWPWKTRAAKQGRYFRVRVEEVVYADLPPDPDAPKLPTSAELLRAARAAAEREGNAELVAEIDRRLKPTAAP